LRKLGAAVKDAALDKVSRIRQHNLARIRNELIK